MTKPEQKQPSKEESFRFEIVYLMPILASLIFGLGCAYVLLPQQQTEVIPVTPISQNTPAGSLGNALYFVILVAAAATLFYLLLKRRSKKLIKALIVVAMTTASLLLSIVYLYAVFAYLPASWGIAIIPISIVITALFDLAIFRLNSVARNVAVVGVGGALGIFFGFEIQLWTAIAILSFLAVYDVIAVYRGPVGKIAQSGMDDLQGLSFAFKDIQMGLGDLVFYSMLTGSMFFFFIKYLGLPLGIIPSLISVVGIMAGSLVTFFMLTKRAIFPGLPFPIMIGIISGLVTGLVINPASLSHFYFVFSCNY